MNNENAKDNAASPLRVERLKPAYVQVSNQLRNQIVAGNVAPGERLPIEADLASMFGVSRSTVREALRALSSQGLISTRRGVNGGTFVAEPDIEELSSVWATSLGFLAGTEELGVEELLLARELLEVPCAGIAARRRNEADLEVLRANLPAEGDIDLRHAFEGNLSFHQGIIAATENRLLGLMTKPLFTVLRTRFLRDRAPSDFWDTVATDHEKILTAVEEQDADRAETEMRQHLSNLREAYEQIVITRVRAGRGDK